MCRLHELAESAIRPTALDLRAGRVSSTDYFNKLVNGNFLSVPMTGCIEDKIDCCVSTICALVKEYNLDFVVEGVAAKSPEFKREHLAAFGEYLELPLRKLSQLLTRLRFLGLRGSKLAFQRMLDSYMAARAAKVGDFDGRPVLIMYLVTALEAHRLWQWRQEHSRPIPWRLRITKKGRIRLVYSCWYHRKASKEGPAHTHFDYVVRVPLAHTTTDSIREFMITNSSVTI